MDNRLAEQSKDSKWTFMSVLFSGVILLNTIILAMLIFTVLREPNWIETGALIYKKIVYIITGVCLFAVISFIIEKKYLARFEKKKLNLFFAVVSFTFLIAYGIFLGLLIYPSYCEMHTDAASVLAGARYFAGLNDEIEWTYFSRWRNNLPAAVFVGLIFRIGTLLQVNNLEWLLVVLNIIQVIITGIAVFILLKKAMGYISAGVAAALLFYLSPIVWGYTEARYTDAFSIGFGVIAFVLWTSSLKKGEKFSKKELAALVFSGIVWAIGTEIKATVAISFIAVVLWVIVSGNIKRYIVNVLAPAACILVASLSFSAYANSLPLKEYDDAWHIPLVYYYMGMGLEGDGSYSDNSEALRLLMSTTGYDNKAEVGKKFIWEHKRAFFDKNHVKQKALVNFGTGTLNVMDFYIDNDPASKGKLFHWCSWQGENRRVYRYWVTAEWDALLIMFAIGWLLMFGKRIPNPYVFTVYATGIGIMMYVMIFEANSRQLYNHWPWFVCGAVITVFKVNSQYKGIVMIRGKA
jgi:hypothetical protein